MLKVQKITHQASKSSPQVRLKLSILGGIRKSRLSVYILRRRDVLVPHVKNLKSVEYLSLCKHTPFTMRIIFMGTPEFAVPSLKALVKSEDEIVAVVTQPDKPKGRGLEIVPPSTYSHFSPF